MKRSHVIPPQPSDRDADIGAGRANAGLDAAHLRIDGVHGHAAELRKLRRGVRNRSGSSYLSLETFSQTFYDTTMEENRYRADTLIELSYCPYVMIYDKPHAPQIILDFQRYINGMIYKVEPKFEDYKPRKSAYLQGK